MADRVRFPDLTPAQFLELLRLAASMKEGLSGVDCHIDNQGPLGLMGAVIMSAEQGKTLLEIARGTMPNVRLELVSGDVPTTPPATPLRDGIFQLIRPPQRASEWLPVEDERLLIAEGEVDVAQELFEELQLSASSLRVAVGRVETAQSSRPVWLFHVRDDPSRASTLRGSRAAGRLIRTQELHAYVDEGLQLFFPPGSAPDRGLFRRLRALAALAPEVAGHLPENEVGPWLAGSVYRGQSSPDSPDWEATVLSALRFQAAFTFTGAPEGLGRVRVQSMVSDEASQNKLREMLAAGTDRVGRHLRVKTRRDPSRTNDRATHEAARLRLQDQRAQAERSLALLAARQQEGSQPRLYRFTQLQLPALGDFLSSFSGNVFEGGGLEYAFQADEEDSLGVHYLLVDPTKAELDDLPPLALYEGPGGSTIRFELDPLWSGLGYRREATSPTLVFVPAGTQLLPDLGAWSPRELGGHLRRMVLHWRGGKEEKVEIPVTPLYIFDPGTAEDPKNGNGKAINLVVLDRLAFKPLATQFHWLNDNLNILRTVEAEKLVQSLASVSERLQLVQSQEEKLEAIEKEFELNLQQMESHALQRLEETSANLSHQVNQALFQVTTLSKQLELLQGFTEEFQQQAMQASTEKYRLLDASDERGLRGELAQVAQRIEQQIDKAKRIEGELEEEALYRIRKLRQARNRLKGDLKRALFMKGKGNDGAGDEDGAE